MAHSHAPHKFDPSNLARLDDPRRAELMPTQPLIEALALGPGQRVADLGCGAGYWLLPLLRGGPADLTLTGLDTEPRMLEILAQRLADEPGRARVELLQTGETLLPLADSSQDVVLMAAVYHEFEDRGATLAELQRVLRVGGQVAIVDWDRLPAGQERTLGPPSDHRIPRAQVEAELQAAGFSAVRSVPGYRESYALLARK